jgi:hypothetical protein
MFNLFLGSLVFAAMLRLTTPILLVSMGGSFGHKGSILDLFNNPVGYRTSPCKMLCILLFFSGCCLKTEVFKQLY